MSADAPLRAIYLVTGIPGAGKTTVARALAAHFERGVHIEGDVLQKMIVSGLVWPQPPEPRGEAAQQLRLRYRNSAMLARSFYDAGFTPVIDDTVIGDQALAIHREELGDRPLHVIVLVPDIGSVRERNAGRDKECLRDVGLSGRRKSARKWRASARGSTAAGRRWRGRWRRYCTWTRTAALRPPRRRFHIAYGSASTRDQSDHCCASTRYELQ